MFIGCRNQWLVSCIHEATFKKLAHLIFVHSFSGTVGIAGALSTSECESDEKLDGESTLFFLLTEEDWEGDTRRLTRWLMLTTHTMLRQNWVHIKGHLLFWSWHSLDMAKNSWVPFSEKKGTHHCNDDQRYDNSQKSYLPGCKGIGWSVEWWGRLMAQLLPRTIQY